jgi:hypothetical protein
MKQEPDMRPTVAGERAHDREAHILVNHFKDALPERDGSGVLTSLLIVIRA